MFRIQRGTFAVTWSCVEDGLRDRDRYPGPAGFMLQYCRLVCARHDPLNKVLNISSIISWIPELHAPMLVAFLLRAGEPR